MGVLNGALNYRFLFIDLCLFVKRVTVTVAL